MANSKVERVRPTWDQLVAKTRIGQASSRLATDLNGERRDELIVTVFESLREQGRSAVRKTDQSLLTCVALLVAFELMFQGAGDIDSLSGFHLSKQVALSVIPIAAGALMVRVAQGGVDMNNYYVAYHGFTRALGDAWADPSVRVVVAGHSAFSLVGDNNWMEAVPWRPTAGRRVTEFAASLNYFFCLVALPGWALSASARVAWRADGWARAWAIAGGIWIVIAASLALATYAVFASIPFWRFLDVRYVEPNAECTMAEAAPEGQAMGEPSQ
jgi:hypothetical protein